LLFARRRSCGAANRGQWPSLGEHNEQIPRDLLGLNDKDIAGLYAARVLVRDPLLEEDGSERRGVEVSGG